MMLVGLGIREGQYQTLAFHMPKEIDLVDFSLLPS